MKILSKCPLCGHFKLYMTSFLVHTNLTKSKAPSKKEYVCSPCWKRFPE